MMKRYCHRCKEIDDSNTQVTKMENRMYQRNQINKATIDGYIKLAGTMKLQYFLTISFNDNKDFPVSDRNVEFILRVLNKELFGKRHLKQGNLVRYMMVRAVSFSGLLHYHILLSGDQKFSFDDLVDAFIACTKKAKCLDTIHFSDKDLLTSGKNKIGIITSSLKKKSKIIFGNNKTADLSEIKHLPSVTKYVLDHLKLPDSGFAVSGDTADGYYEFNTRCG